MKRYLFCLSIFLFLFVVAAFGQSNQTVNSGDNTTAVSFPGSGCTYNWVNSNPAIGLAAGGTGNISSFKTVNTGNNPVTATITGTPVSTGFAYIPNAGSGTVSVINLSTNQVVNTITVGVVPQGVAVSPDGSQVCIADGFDYEIYVINTATNAIVSTIPSGSAVGMCFSPDGSKLYVAFGNSDSVEAYNTANYTLLHSYAVGNITSSLSVSPDGTFVYVAESPANSICAINTTTYSINTFSCGGVNPIDAALSPDGSLLYVTNQGSNDVTVINTATQAVTATIPVGQSPACLAFSPDASRLYVTNNGSATVSVIETAANSVIATVSVEVDPFGIDVGPDGSAVYVINGTTAGAVSVISTASNAVTSIIPVGIMPNGIGNFIEKVNSPCAPVTFTITVNPAALSPPTITAAAATGSISACSGTASVSPQIQQFTVSGSSLTGNITVTAPAGFQISLSGNSGYTSSITIDQSSGSVGNTVIYVRSTATAPTGSISGKLEITSPGATTQEIMVTGAVTVSPIVNAVTDQTVTNGTATAAITFSGTANTYTWFNNTPAIGLASSGTGDISSFTAINKGTTPVIASITVAPQNDNLLYVANFGANTVWTIDPANNSLVSTINVGLEPATMTLSPDGSKLFVAGDTAVSVINTTNNKVIKTIGSLASPSDVALSPDGTVLYICSFGGNEVYFFNSSSYKLISTVPTGQFPGKICLSADGTRLYVTNYGSNNVSVINTSTATSVTTIPVGLNPQGLALNPTGTLLYVTNQGGHSISVINTGTNNVSQVIQVGGSPTDVVVNSTGNFIYICNKSTGTISVISSVTNTVAATISGFNNPASLLLSPDGTKLYVANQRGENVKVVDVATRTVISTLATNSQPAGLALLNNGASCPGIPITFIITVNPGSSAATINASGELHPLTTTYGTPSPSESFMVSAQLLMSGIMVTAPTGFEVSTDNTNFSAVVTLGSSGNIAAKPVYIRLAAASPVDDNYSGDIILTSPDAPSANESMPVSTVTPALLTIVADDKIRAFDLPNPNLTASYVGFVNFDTPEQLTSLPVLATSAITTSPVGIYPITVSGASAINYIVTYLDGTLTIQPSESAIVIPNTFTPNGDGVNDTWDIKYLNTYASCSVDIFTRWGQKIYSSTGYPIPWDGTYRGSALPTGTYYYIINLKNGLNPLSGFVAIIH